MIKQNLENSMPKMNLIVSDTVSNKLYQGDYIRKSNGDNMLSFKKNFKDFRKIAKFYQLGKNQQFVQIENLSYRMHQNGLK